MTLLSSVAAVGETPIDRFLADQADLSAVERFSQRHSDVLDHQQARYYRDLIPLNRPEPGQQYGFEVDLDSCTGCKACVTACHALNGLDEDESWRSVTLLRGGTAAEPFQQSVTAACHHCLDPACLNGCPVDAYEKDPVTGVVVHLDDQCIGCGYCTLTCPYEVPTFSQKRGIVRKCDMCQGRLAGGEAPACVQACPNGAIKITLVDTAAATEAAAGTALVPGAPPSSITVPTTVYRTARPGLRDASASAAAPAGPAQAHTPLAVMLVLTQLSVGAFVTALLLRGFSDRGVAGSLHSFDAVLAVAAGVLALGASVLHLGRPRYCYRAVIGFRHSWLSREVVAFGGFTILASLYALVVGLRWPVDGTTVATTLGGVTAAVGLVGVACSVMIYATTRRSSWRAMRLVPKFASTTAMCGLATVVWASMVSALLFSATSAATEAPTTLTFSASGRWLLAVLAGLATIKLVVEAAVFRHRFGAGTGDREGARVAFLLGRELRATAGWRFATGLIGGVVLPLVLVATGYGGGRTSWLALAIATLTLVAVTTGELLERSLFFTTVGPPR